jgi:hypothetical protein
MSLNRLVLWLRFLSGLKDLEFADCLWHMFIGRYQQTIDTRIHQRGRWQESK